MITKVSCKRILKTAPGDISCVTASITSLQLQCKDSVKNPVYPNNQPTGATWSDKQQYISLQTLTIITTQIIKKLTLAGHKRSQRGTYCLFATTEP